MGPWSVTQFDFIVRPNRGLPTYIEIKVLTTFFYRIQNFFKKQKATWNKFPRLIFCMIFVEKYFSPYILTDQIYLSDCVYFLRCWSICVLRLCFPVCNVINFEINALSVNPTKWQTHSTMRRQIADELFECVWPFC